MRKRARDATPISATTQTMERRLQLGMRTGMKVTRTQTTKVTTTKLTTMMTMTTTMKTSSKMWGAESLQGPENTARNFVG